MSGLSGVRPDRFGNLAVRAAPDLGCPTGVEHHRFDAVHLLEERTVAGVLESFCNDHRLLCLLDERDRNLNWYLAYRRRITVAAGQKEERTRNRNVIIRCLFIKQ